METNLSPSERTYHGFRDDENTCHVQVVERGCLADRPLPLRLDLANKSPTGFEWSYGGSGPAQLALALCADALGDDEAALDLFQLFKSRVIATLPRERPWSGPYQPGDVLAVEVVRTRAQVLEDAYVRLHGERVPGREPRTRNEHEQRLQILAGAVAATSDDWQRQMQLHRQFHEAADRIGLVQGKRTWLLNTAAWARRSNAPPTMADLWVDAVASPSCLARPRPQDFDPDPRARRRRTSLPAYVASDPRSIPNMLHALRAASLTARVIRLGDPPHDRGHVQIAMPVKGRSRFVAIAERDIHGRMAWRVVWDGHDSKAGQLRHRRCLQCDAYARTVEVLRHGRRGVQADLFHPLTWPRPP